MSCKTVSESDGIYALKNTLFVVGFEVFTFTVVRIMMFFWVLAPCRLVGRCIYIINSIITLFIVIRLDNARH
jgi:hypothetical protein